MREAHPRECKTVTHKDQQALHPAARDRRCSPPVVNGIDLTHRDFQGSGNGLTTIFGKLRSDQISTLMYSAEQISFSLF